MKRRILSMLLALTMLLSLVPAAVFATDSGTEEGLVTDKNNDNKIVYVSLGDSTTNGYGLTGYEIADDILKPASLACYNYFWQNFPLYTGGGVFPDGQVRNENDGHANYFYWTKGHVQNVNGLLQETPMAYPNLFAQELDALTDDPFYHIQLAVSAMRADDVAFLLTKNSDAAFVKDEYSGNISSEQYAILNFTGDTNAANMPFEWRYNYDKPEGSGYDDWDASATESMAQLYQNSVKNADVITLNLGSNNFSVYIMGAIKGYLGIDDVGYVPEMDKLLATLDEEDQAKVEKARALYAEAEKYLMDELTKLEEYADLKDALADIFKYCEYTFISFCVNYERILDRVSDLNGKADVIIMPATNYMSGFKLKTETGTIIDLSKYVGYTLDLANAYVTNMATEKSANGELNNAIYVADAGVDVDTFIDQLVARVESGREDVFEGYGVLRKRMINGIYWLAAFMNNALDYYAPEAKVDIGSDADGWVTVAEIEEYEANGCVWEGDAVKARRLAYYMGFEKVMIEALKDGCMSAEVFSEMLTTGDLYTTLARAFYPAGLVTVNNDGADPEAIAASIRNAKNLSMLYFLDYFWVNNGVMCHPSEVGYADMAEALESAYLTEDKVTVEEGAAKKANDLMADGYFFLKDDQMMGTAEKLEMIDMFAASLKDELTQDEDAKKALQTLSELNAYLRGENYIDDQKTLDIILSVYAALLNGMTERDIKDAALFIYNTLTGEKEAKPVVYTAAGSSSSGSTALTAAKKLEIINGVYGILDGAGYMTDVAQLDDMKAIFDKLEADEDAAVKVFETLLYGVLEPETSADIDVAGISASVYNTVMSSNIPADKKMEIIEDVADLLAESQLGVQTGLPTDKLAVIKALRKRLVKYFDDAQLVEIIDLVSELIADGSFDRDTAILADELHNKLLGRDDLSAADKAEIIMTVYDVLEEEGLVEYAVTGALAYAYLEAVNKGYLDAAIKGLQIAQEAIGTAKDFVNKNVPAEYAAIRDLMIEELDNTAETLAKLEALLKSNPAEVSVEDILALEENLWNHLDTLKDLGLAAGAEIDPYLKKINKAVVEFNDVVEGIIDEAYAIISAVKSFPEAYAAWVEEVGAKVDTISPELGALVRKYLNDNAADAMAILAVYGEEAVTKLVAEAVAAYGEIADVAMELFYVLSVYGEKIYEAVENNPEIDRLIEAVKAQLAEAKELVERIDEHPFEGAYNAAVADKQAALDAVYAELAIHYAELQKILASVIEDVDPIAAEALSDAVAALCKAMGITYDAAEGYMGWLADHADAMACELLCALLENTWEFIVAASPIADQVMYDWLYNNPETVIAFFVENAAEIEALIEKYGPAVVGVIAYIGATYGPEVLDFIIENPCEALDMFMDWYNKYGYRIWPMIDVYLEALGVYDAIDEQLEAVKAMLSELDAHILAQIAALKAALLDASEELRAQIEAEIEALYEQLMAFLKANISAKYVVGPNSYYVALGDAGAYGPAADKLAAELGMSDKYANLTFPDASASEVLANLSAAAAGDEFASYAAEIAKADLITLGFGANTFTAAVAADVMNAAFGEIVEKDWAALVGEEGAATIEAALVELNAYVAEEVEDEAVAALLTAAVESFAYTYINHLVDYVVVSEAIHEINADALLVLVGMHNPMDGVVIDLDGEQLDLGEYLNYLVMLTNIYSFGYALIAEDTIYVDAPAVETNYDGAVMDIMTFVSDLLGFEEAVVKYQPTDAGYEYIQEQIYNALNPTLYEEEEACQHGVLGSLKFQWAGDYSTCVAVYTCALCGESFTKDCDVVILETKQPTVEEEGYVKYRATVEILGETHINEQTVTLAKLPAPDTGDTAMIGLYVTVMLFAAAGAVVVLKKKKHA